ncbi:DinB translesion DNA repair polymerase [Schizosaccharomyces japonicus yFS275]|uniref:DNA polymerase kappa n=1 Tax=Schizosaccharomyces japonicus (strain yFS275 / FY16936) TaxID=402676 RepID=B6K5W3_SCHJY|nr:DinB translesion DNA repair polymerase [Schizosaccharomyces japonicus yFS275]EEB08917.2 DinB translesion DNA repair polymerase [Schizosaccharomyces japonicus yFS275]
MSICSQDEANDDDLKNEDLMHRLAGPSVMKPGQEEVDQQKINQVIYEASKGSKFFENEQKKARYWQEKNKEMKLKLEELELGLENNPEKAAKWSEDMHKIDQLINSMEAQRDLSRIIVHVDCDAFYASVEELEKPAYKTKPMAVGQGVLCTANYCARKFGVRSAMPEFIARQLCPNLIVLPLRMMKYQEKSAEIAKILQEYDPNMCKASVDEAYLDLTDYLTKHNEEETVEAVVEHLRQTVAEKTGITVSCGIGANLMLAKIASNMRKPNDQFSIGRTREAILEFMDTLPCRKVNGIGRVLEQELSSLNVHNCGDILRRKGYLYYVFQEKSFQNLLSYALGISNNVVKPTDASNRKSIGNEMTFSIPMGSEKTISQKLKQLCFSVSETMKQRNLVGNSVVLKLKTTSFEVRTRQTNLNTYTNESDIIYKYVLQLLSYELPVQVRLLGVRMTKLQDASIYEESKLSFTKENGVQCPICSRYLINDACSVDKHIEECLSVTYIKECLQTKTSVKKRSKRRIDEYFR